MDPLDRRIDLLHRLTGSSPVVLLALLFFPERSLRFTDLVRTTGKSKPTVLDALRVLADLELVQKQAGSGWVITGRCRQMTLGEVLEEVEEGKESLPCLCSSSSIECESKDIDNTTTTTTGVKILYPHIIRLSDDSTEAALARNGIFPNLVEELLQDEWVTAARVEAWAARLATDKTVRNIAAVLYANLRDHVEPPPVRAEPGSNPRRFIEGKYADYIEH